MTYPFPGRPLSPGECKVMTLLVRGMRDCVVAQRMGLSPKTISTHKTRALSKMGMESIHEVGNYLLTQQLPDEEMSAIRHMLENAKPVDESRAA